MDASSGGRVVLTLLNQMLAPVGVSTAQTEGVYYVIDRDFSGRINIINGPTSRLLAYIVKHDTSQLHYVRWLVPIERVKTILNPSIFVCVHYVTSSEQVSEKLEIENRKYKCKHVIAETGTDKKQALFNWADYSSPSQKKPLIAMYELDGRWLCDRETAPLITRNVRFVEYVVAGTGLTPTTQTNTLFTEDPDDEQFYVPFISGPDSSKLAIYDKKLGQALFTKKELSKFTSLPVPAASEASQLTAGPPCFS